MRSLKSLTDNKISMCKWDLTRYINSETKKKHLEVIMKPPKI